MNSPNPAQLSEVVILLSFFGAFGGMLAGLSECSLRDIREKGVECYGSAGRLAASLIVAGLYGVGGALVLGIISALDGKFDDFTQTRRIYFALLSVAAGFAGLQLLTLFRKRLLKEMEETIKEETRRNREKLEESTTRKVNQEAKIRDAIDAVIYALDNLPGDRLEDPSFQSLARKARGDAEQALLDVPTHRRLTILLGRLERETNGYAAAISVLTKTVAAWKRAKLAPNEDYAAILYNRACYKNRLAAQADQPADAEKLRQDAWEDLKEACRHDATNLDEAKDDPDLKNLLDGIRRKWDDLP